MDGDDLLFNTDADSVKGRDLARDPRVSICVDDDHPPFAFVTVEGRATLIDDLPTVRQWATRIAARYMGEGPSEAYGKRNSEPGALLVRIDPDKILATKNGTGGRAAVPPPPGPRSRRPSGPFPAPPRSRPGGRLLPVLTAPVRRSGARLMDAGGDSADACDETVVCQLS